MQVIPLKWYYKNLISKNLTIFKLLKLQQYLNICNDSLEVSNRNSLKKKSKNWNNIFINKTATILHNVINFRIDNLNGIKNESINMCQRMKLIVDFDFEIKKQNYLILSSILYFIQNFVRLLRTRAYPLKIYIQTYK